MANPNEFRREQARRATNKDAALDALLQAGSLGVTNVRLMEIAGSRAGSRVQELRQAGYVVDCVQIQRGLYLYRLTATPEQTQPQPGTPGYLHSLQVVASIDQRGTVRPFSADTAPADGRLF